MSFFVAALLGIVEGVTEFLPISSTGHLILTERLLGVTFTESVASFDIAIQLGAIAAVAILTGRKLLGNRRVLWLTFVAFLPTAIIGVLVHGLAKTYLLGNVTVVLWSLFLGGIFLIFFELLHSNRPARYQESTQITLLMAILIGCFQSIAIIPGISRSAATIIGGMLLGMERRAIVEFSFFLAIPTMAAATGFDLLKSAPNLSLHDAEVIAVGFLFSLLTALIAIKWLLRFIKTHTFIPFGFERIGIAVLVWLFIQSY
jgi:undecaprenyl-diphosphatase